MSNNQSSAGTVLLAFAIGAVAGAAVALLYAPGTGEETRRRLADKAREGKQRAESALREGREVLRRQRDTLTEAIDRGREVFEEMSRTEPL